MRVLDWLHGELGPDEVPDSNIWHHSKRLEEHWLAVKQRRKDRASGTSTDDDDDDDQGMTQNELTKGLRD